MTSPTGRTCATCGTPTVRRSAFGPHPKYCDDCRPKALVGTCALCGRDGQRLLRTACQACYNRAWRAGTAHTIPAQPRADLTLRTEKRCPTCTRTLPVDAFDLSQDRADGRQGWCRECHAAKRAQRDTRAYELKRHYGLTHQDYDALLAVQLGGCAICGSKPDEGAFLDVDHDHVTGGVRGLLCQLCNKAVGLFRDDPNLLTAAAVYLQEVNADV